MTTDEKIDLLIREISDMKSDMSEMKAEMSDMKAEMSEMKADMSEMKADMSDMKAEMSDMKADMSDMKEDISVLKKTAIKTEMELAPKIQLLLENHTDLAQNVNVAKDVDSRVGMLEFQMKVVQGVLDTIRDKLANSI